MAALAHYTGLRGDRKHVVLIPHPAQTVLHFVASKNNLEVAKKLFEQKPPASARVRDKRGQYALHRAAAVGSVPMVNLLIKNRSPLNATDLSGYTALHHAVAEGHGEFCLLAAFSTAATLPVDRLIRRRRIMLFR